jgi:hypothetical protein
LNAVANSATGEETLASPKNAHNRQASSVITLYPTYRFLLQIVVRVLADKIAHVHRGIETERAGVRERDSV